MRVARCKPCAANPLLPLRRCSPAPRPDGGRDELSRLHPSVDFLLGAALGPHPLLDELVAERIRELDPRDPHNAAARVDVSFGFFRD